MKSSLPHWILHKYILRADEYECSLCHSISSDPLAACPHCGAKIRNVKSSPDYVDELELLDIFGGK